MTSIRKKFLKGKQILPRTKNLSYKKIEREKTQFEKNFIECNSKFRFDIY